MRDWIVMLLPWVLSAITLWMTVLAGNRHRYAWAIGLGNQALWLCWIVAAEAWGLIPMNIALWVVYARNHLKWCVAAREPHPNHEPPPLGRPDLVDDHETPACDQIDALFARHGLSRPPWQLRDKLVGMMLWSQWAWWRHVRESSK